MHACVCVHACTRVCTGPPFFFGGFGEKKSKLIHTSPFFYVYMSKCRQFKGLSIGMSILTIPNHTIKLQLHCRGTTLFLEEKNIK